MATMAWLCFLNWSALLPFLTLPSFQQAETGDVGDHSTCYVSDVTDENYLEMQETKAWSKSLHSVLAATDHSVM